MRDTKAEEVVLGLNKEDSVINGEPETDIVLILDDDKDAPGKVEIEAYNDVDEVEVATGLVV